MGSWPRDKTGPRLPTPVPIPHVPTGSRTQTLAAMDPSKLGELRSFVEACKKDPALLADPALAFFRDYLASLGAKPRPQPPHLLRPGKSDSGHSGGQLPLRRARGRTSRSVQISDPKLPRLTFAPKP